MATVKDKTKFVGNMKDFFVAVSEEMKKIVWPSREVLIQSTVTVTIIVLVLTVYMGVFDFIMRKIFDLLH